MKLLVSAMRQAAHSVAAAELAVRHRDEGVVGFDIAGPEAGFPPTRHLDAFQLIQRENFHVTIHAGESFGLPSIWEALQWRGAATSRPERSPRSSNNPIDLLRRLRYRVTVNTRQPAHERRDDDLGGPRPVRHIRNRARRHGGDGAATAARAERNRRRDP